jgi:hypothetical protein
MTVLKNCNGNKITLILRMKKLRFQRFYKTRKWHFPSSTPFQPLLISSPTKPHVLLPGRRLWVSNVKVVKKGQGKGKTTFQGDR